MAVHAPSQVDRERIRELTDREAQTLNERTPKSRAMCERARASLAGGVASSYQVREPWPIYLERGEGARVWDVDGNELLDFHNGFGSMTQGHAHPAISRAVERRIQAGTHFAAPTEDAVTVAELTVAVPFNDVDAMERRIERLESDGRAPACVIMEAAMMNLGIVPPEPGYLEAVRELTKRRGIVLIFDEVKTGFTIAAGGATERFGVRPDLVTLAKSLGGGLPSGAIGGTDEAMRVVEDGSVYQVGTFNGNPLSMAAARANLEEVLTPPAYEHLDHLNERILKGCARVIEEHKLPGYAIGIAAKGCVTFATDRIVDYASFSANQDAELTDLAWLYSMNRGIFMTPGREEEWTLTVVHDDAAVDRYVAVFAELADELTA